MSWRVSRFPDANTCPLPPDHTGSRERCNRPFRFPHGDFDKDECIFRRQPAPDGVTDRLRIENESDIRYGEWAIKDKGREFSDFLATFAPWRE